MGRTRPGEFRQDAVRVALSRGLTRKQVADDLGVGMLTLNKWITARRDTDVVSKEDLSLAQENDRLRRESRILKEEREILKRPRCSSRAKSLEAGMPPLKCLAFWDMIILFSEGRDDGWQVRKAGRYRAESFAG
jgi:transposase